MTDQSELSLEDFLLSPEEEFKIKTVCEFLFFDQFKDYATYNRFEQCFQPLINDLNLSTDKIFKELAGEQKKYITYKRFINCYLANKNKTKILPKDVRTFFNFLMTNLIHGEDSPIGNPKEKVLTFSTTKSNRNRKFISLVEVLTDKNGIIHGLNLQYEDQLVKQKLYPKTIEGELLVSIEMNLGLLIDEKHNVGKNKITKEKELFYRDYVTHIFGTFNKNSEIISFLGFKCVSGKTEFVGAPSGEGFIFGGWGTKFHQLKMQVTDKGITYFQPIFNENPRTNFYLKKEKDYTKEKIEEDTELILDEPQLAKLTDEIEIDKFITTPLISDDLFFNPKFKDEISGSDYKEIVNQSSRQWLLPKGRGVAPRKFLSLNEALRVYEDEKQKRDLFKEKEKEKKRNDENKQNSEEQNILRNNKEKENKIKKKKLHKTKKLSKNVNGEKKWDGDVENVKPKSIFMSRQNYQTLKNKLAQNILEEINSNEEDPSNTKEYLIESIIPEIAELKGSNAFFGKTHEIPNLNQKKLHMQVHKLNINNLNEEKKDYRKIKKTKKVNLYKNEDNYLDDSNKLDEETDINKEEIENEDNNNENDKESGEKNKKDENDDTRKYYSDALELFNELSNKDEENEQKNNEDNLFGFGFPERYFKKNQGADTKKLNDKTGVYNYAPVVQYSCDENHSYYTSGDKNKNNNKTYNIYDNIYSSVSDNMKNNNNPKYNYNYLLVNNKYKNDPIRVKQMQNNWRYFSKEIKRVSGVYVLQTIGTILKTIKTLKNDSISKEKLPLYEKIKLFKLLEENQAVVEFLNKEKEIQNLKISTVPTKRVSKKDINIIKNENLDEENNNDDENDNDEFMLPDEHPEKTLCLNDIEEKLRDISILLENKKLREEQRRKIAILKNLFLQQKNIFVENETKKVKDDIINNNKELNLDNLIKDETTKRTKAEKEEQKTIESKLGQIPEEPIEDQNEILSLVGAEVPNKIYRKQTLCKTSGNWTDFLFSPQTRSLCPYNSNGFLFPEGVNPQDLIGWNNFKWFRPEIIFDTPNYIILPDDITPNDIIQGCLNDSYFLSVLGSLCKCPKIIEKLFFIKEKTKEHLYGIYFNIHGQWKLVLIDDNFPVTDDKNFKKFAFSHCRNREIWVNLLEKAWAKINGCYAKIGGNFSPYEIFDVLTEAYTEVIILNKNKIRLKENLWKKILNAEKNNFIIIAVSNNSSSVEEIGLVPGNPYIISNIYEINSGKDSEKLLKLSNPWGDAEFSGDWSENCSKWTEELKEKLKYSEKKDGDFFISYSDFINYYGSVGIVKLHEDYLSNSIRISKHQAKKAQLIKIKVLSKECHAYIQLYQKNPRIVLSDGSYQKPELSYIILTDKNFNYITSMSSNNMHLCVEHNLERGDYYLFCDVNYRYVNPNQKVHGYNITSYSDNEIQFENVTEEVNIKECLHKSMITYCKNNIKSYLVNKVNVYFTKSFNDDVPFVVGYFENNTSTDNKISIDLKSKGEKSCCFYNDDIANEDDECILKDLPAKKSCIFLVMKYSMTSLFTINYLITSNIEKLESKKKEVDNAKIKTILLKNSRASKKLDSKIVFNEEGHPLDIEPTLIQYVLEINEGYIIGLENTSKKKLKLKLSLDGLELTDSIYKGRSSPTFFIEPNEKKTFNAVIKNRFNGDLSFKFELVKK